MLGTVIACGDTCVKGCAALPNARSDPTRERGAADAQTPLTRAAKKAARMAKLSRWLLREVATRKVSA